MERRAFEAALKAALKITFGTTLLGCGGSVAFEHEAAETEPEGGAGGFYVAQGGAGGTVEVPVCAQPAEPPGGWAVYDQATFDCCVARIGALAPDEFPSEDWQFSTPLDPAISNCCGQLLGENYSALWSGEPLVHPAPDAVIGACCIHQHGNLGCTPWGPPVPVAMDPGDYVPWIMDELGEHPVRDARGTA